MANTHPPKSTETQPELLRNMLLLIGSALLTKAGDALANPKTVLAWLLGSVGAPESIIGMLVPLRESGSMLPQAYLSKWVRPYRFRKQIWVVGSIAQGIAILGIAITSLLIKGFAAGLWVLLFLTIFSLSRSLCSITSKDVLGKTIPKTRRGTVAGISTSLSNLLVMGVGIYLIASRKTFQDTSIVFLVSGAGMCWFVAAALYRGIEEPRGEIGEKGNLPSLFARLRVLRQDRVFVRFLYARGFLVVSALSAPFYVRMVQERTDGGPHWLGLFMIAQGLAAGLSGYFWGRVADRSSRLSMVLGGTLTTVLGFLVGGFALWAPLHSALPWVGVTAFFLLGIAHNGVRIGRKTYVVNMAAGNQRTEYVSISNTLIGVLLLIAGCLGTVAEWVGPGGILIVMALFGSVGVSVALSLPEVEEE